jgi:hypothetical protein
VEFCENDQQEIRERFYLNKYLPCLNTVFQSKITAKSVNRSLYKLFLSERQNLYKKPQRRTGVLIWVYKILQTQIEKTYAKYPSIVKASEATGRDRGTIRTFLDTNVPIKGYLFFTRPILDFDKSFIKAKGYLSEINIDPSLPVEV